jgi:hypothetical protein
MCWLSPINSGYLPTGCSEISGFPLRSGFPQAGTCLFVARLAVGPELARGLLRLLAFSRRLEVDPAEPRLSPANHARHDANRIDRGMDTQAGPSYPEQASENQESSQNPTLRSAPRSGHKATSVANWLIL